MQHLIFSVVVMIAELSMAPDNRDDFVDFANANLEASRSYPGNITFDVLIDETRPGVVVFYEVWESVEAQKKYMAWRIEAGDLEKLNAYLNAPPKFTAYRRAPEAVGR